MDPVFGQIALFIVITVVSALAWHFWIKRFLLASVGAGLTAAAVALVLRGISGHATWDLFFFAILSVNATIFALGVGIPFNRRRNPLAGEFASPFNPNLSLPMSGRDLIITIVVGIVFLYLFFVKK